MSYGMFSTYEEVAIKFQIKLKEDAFIKEEPLNINPILFKLIDENLKSRRSYVSENAICETIISPILNIITRENNIPLWSHVRFDVSESEGLVGIPDFIIAPASDIGITFTKPIVCISEAKKDNFNEGWAQVLAEMIAAQIFNGNEPIEVYGIVTTGNFWEFGKLTKNSLTREIVSISATDNLQKLLNIINWIVITAKEAI